MIPSTLFALAAVLSSLSGVNGVVIQRDPTFTYLTPQPTMGAGGQTTTQSSAATSTVTNTNTSSPTTTATTPPTYSQSGPTIIPTTSGTGQLPPPPPQSSSTQSVIPTTSATGQLPPPKVSSTQSVNSTTSASGQIPPKTSATSTPSLPPTSSYPATSVPLPISQPIPSQTPTPTTVPTCTTAPGTANCDGIQQWQAAFAYTAGAQVIFNNQLYTAKQWTYNNAPPAHADQWTAGGTCSQPIHNKANCKGVAGWQSTVAYTAGNQVTYQNHLWSAVQWTTSNSPGDASGSWQDLGLCA